MKKVFLVVFCVLSLFVMYGQTNTSSIDSLLEKALYFNQKNQDSAVFFSEKAYHLAKEKGAPSEIANTAYFYSFYLIAGNQFNSAEQIIVSTLSSEEKITYITNGNLYYNKATIAFLKEEYDRALTDFLTASNYFEAAGNRKNMARTYLQLSVIYQKINNQELSDYFGNLSLQNIRETTDHGGEIKENRSANQLEKFLVSSHVKSKLKSVLHYNLAKEYLKQGAYKKSITHFTTSLKIKEEKGYTNLLVETKTGLAEAYLGDNVPKKSLETLQNIKSQEKRKQPLKIEHLLTESYKSLEKFEEALVHNERLAFLQDSVTTIDENVRIAEITAQYDTEKKEVQILELKEENEVAKSLLSEQKKRGLIISLIAILLLITSVWFIRRWKKSSKRALEASLETEVIKKKVEAQHLLLKNKSKVYLDDLQFIKSDGNYIEFHSVEQRTLDRNKLKAILSQLPPNFVRVHRSYIVNKNEIASFTSTAVYLKSGVEIPLSRTFKSNL